MINYGFASIVLLLSTSFSCLSSSFCPFDFEGAATSSIESQIDQEGHYLRCKYFEVKLLLLTP
jgi:hypothetical protein